MKRTGATWSLARWSKRAPGLWPKITPEVLSALLAALVLLFAPAHAAEVPPAVGVKNSPRLLSPSGVPTDDHFFPIAVWLQNPRNAARYRAAGINLYVGLWQGPTPAQLAELEKAGMPVICDQSRTGLENIGNPIIAAWMHGDEPDNAQSLATGKGYGPPILPERILKDYQRLRAADPSRPVLLNLGQGVAWDNYIGRGVRRNHPEDYPEYLKGCDIASFDIYPAAHDSPEIAGKLEFVAQGVERLVGWTRGEKPVWNCIECTHISNPRAKATPQQVRAEVWMALIRGSRGLIYFAHQFKPVFREAALLDDPEMLAAVTAINRQVRELAPVLNGPTVTNGFTVQFSPASSPVAAMMKRRGDSTFLFAVNLRSEPTRATFTLRGKDAGQPVEVLGESRKIGFQSGSFSDEFGSYAVHLYHLHAAK
jgi:hypothetical protein